MKVYKLSLFKGAFQTLSNEDLSKKNLFLMLGYMDYLRFEEVSEFSKMVAYNRSREIHEKHYLRYPLFILDSNEQGPPFIEERQKDSLFLICTLKLNMTYLEADTASGLMEDVYGTIRDSLKYIGTEYSGMKIYSSPGSFDVVLIYWSNSFSELAYAKSMLHNIMLPNFDEPLFSTMNAFTIVHPSLDPKFLENGLYGAELQLGFSGEIPTEDDLLEHLEPLLKAENISDNATSGNSQVAYTLKYEIVSFSGGIECTVRLINISLRAILSVFGWGVLSKKEYLNWSDWSKKKIRVSNTYLYCSFDKITSYQYKGRVKDPEQIVDFQRLVSYVEELSKELADKYFPIPSQRDFAVLRDVCQRLGKSKHQKISGIKIATIFYYVLRVIHDHAATLDPEAINACLHDVGMMANMAMQSDSIQIEMVDGDILDSASPFSKFLYSYENIIQEARENISGTQTTAPNRTGRNDLLIFFSVNYSDDLKSKFYFRTFAGKLPRIVSINLPNTEFYNIRRSFPFIYHELGHYTALREENKPFRNKQFSSIIKNHIALYVFNDLHNQYNLEISKETVKELVNRFWALSAPEDFNEGSLDVFIGKLKDKLHKSAYFFMQLLNVSESKLDGLFIALLLSSIRTLLKDNGYLYFYDHLFRETHADLVMIYFSEMSSVSYLQELYRNMKDNKKTQNVDNPYKDKIFPPEMDSDFSLRIAAVLLQQNKDNPQDLDVIYETLADDEKDFFENVFYTMERSKVFLQPIVNYLTNIKENLYQGGAKPAYFPNIESFGQQMTEMMEHWYKNIRYWGEQANGIVQRSGASR